VSAKRISFADAATAAEIQRKNHSKKYLRKLIGNLLPLQAVQRVLRFTQRRA